MTVPVIKQLLLQYPHLEVTVLSDPFTEPLFAGVDRLHFYGANTRNEYRGLTGLFRLAKQIKRDLKFTAVADLHNVLRTKIIRYLLPGPVAVINKGRAEKKQLTRPANKILRPLPTTFQRYASVFSTLGFPVGLPENDFARPKPLSHGHPRTIGVAPFAKHQMKMYPLERMKETVAILAAQNIRIKLFGSRSESSVLDEWADTIDGVESLAGKVNFAEELKLISKLDCMISMDSANMHLASLYHVPVVSIWGGTHPWLGFYGWQQSPGNAVQADLPCRPSSVFGNKPCPVHGEAGCMQQITPAMIADRVMQVLSV